MRGHYDPNNPKHRNQVLWTSEGEATETFTRIVIPFLRAIINHKMLVTKTDLVNKVKVAVTYDGVDEIKTYTEDRYREFWALFKGTYGFSKQGNSTGEVYEFFPNTGRYFFIPILPPTDVNLVDKIKRLPIKDLQDPQKVTQIFNSYYPETYKGTALVYQVGDILAVMNTHENDDIIDNYSVPLKRGIFNSISGESNVHSYLMGKFENNNKQLWLQLNTNYAERNSKFSINCIKEPKVKIVPQEAIITCKWDAKTKELVLELNHKLYSGSSICARRCSLRCRSGSWPCRSCLPRPNPSFPEACCKRRLAIRSTPSTTTPSAQAEVSAIRRAAISSRPIWSWKTTYPEETSPWFSATMEPGSGPTRAGPCTGSMVTRSPGTEAATGSTGISGTLRSSELRRRPCVRSGTPASPPGGATARPASAGAVSATDGYCPAGGSQSSTLLPSGSMTQANLPYSDSSIFSRTLQPSSRRTATRPPRSSTR